MDPFDHMPNQIAQLLKMMSSASSEAGYKDLAAMAARVQRHHFEELRRQGFTDTEAITLVASSNLFKGK